MDIEDMSIESLEKHLERMKEEARNPWESLKLTDDDSSYQGFKFKGRNILLVDRTKKEFLENVKDGLSVAEFYGDSLPKGYKYELEYLHGIILVKIVKIEGY